MDREVSLKSGVEHRLGGQIGGQEAQELAVWLNPGGAAVAPPDDPMSDDREARRLQLADGRWLGWSDLGDPDGGSTLLYFHGHPDSRLEARFLDDQAAERGVRLIGIDRPGFGLSTPQTNRRIVDWPADVRSFADELGLGRFAVVGVSAGGPYALACAALMRERVTSCGVVSGVGKLGRWASVLSRIMPGLVMPIARRSFRDRAHALGTLRMAARRWPVPDRKLFEAPGVIDVMADSLMEGMRQGVGAGVQEAGLLGRSWGFEVAAVMTGVSLWHGELDDQVPVGLARAIANQLPRCSATFFPEEAHLSTLVNHRHEIVGTLTAPG